MDGHLSPHFCKKDRFAQILIGHIPSVEKLQLFDIGGVSAAMDGKYLAP